MRRFFIKLMNILMLSCEKSTELMEKDIQNSLRFHERVQLRIHTGMCSACTTYQKHIKFIDSTLRNNKVKSNLSNHSSIIKSRIQDKIKNITDN